MDDKMLALSLALCDVSSFLSLAQSGVVASTSMLADMGADEETLGTLVDMSEKLFEYRDIASDLSIEIAGGARNGEAD